VQRARGFSIVWGPVLLGIFGIVVCCGVVGCETAGPQSFEETILAAQKIVEVAREAGAHGKFKISSRGDPGIVEEAAIRLDTGLTLEFEMGYDFRPGATVPPGGSPGTGNVTSGGT